MSLARRGRITGRAPGVASSFTAATAEGVLTYLSRTAEFSPSPTDGKQGLLGISLRGLPNSEASTIVARATDRFAVTRTVSNTFQITGKNAAGTTILSMTSDSAYIGGGVLAILATWDLLAGTGQLYINRADDLAASPTLTNDSIDWTGGNWGAFGTHTGASLVDGVIRALYLNTAETLDLSTEANRRKLFDESGRPRWDADGSSVTGTAPLIALADDYLSFERNWSGAGDLTVNGVLTGSAW